VLLVAAVLALIATACGPVGPAPSRPPGGWLAYVNAEPGGSEGIYVSNPDGTGRRRISSATGPGLSWSPDGSRLVFTSNPGISVMNADGSGVTRLAESGEGPAWSPDGRQIAFSIRPNESLSQGEPDAATIDLIKQEHLRLMNVDGSGLTGLTSGTVSDEWPSWSPDGTRLAFDRSHLSVMPEGDCIGICLIDADGSGLIQLPVDGARPAWSPDGRTIAYAWNFGPAAGIWISDADGSGPMNLTPDLAVGPVIDFSYPTWSPDGSMLAFSLRLRDAPADIYLVGRDGSNLLRIIEDVGVLWGLAWR
jgi:TolB protein